MTESPVYRSPMWSRDDAVPIGIAVERALTEGVCGVGGRLEGVPPSLDVAVAAVANRHDERIARRLERFANAPTGSFVWTRDVDGLLWLGRLTGEWHYDVSPEAHDADLAHVRACDWLPEPIHEEAAPAGVLATFARGGRNWQQIHAPGIERETAQLWAH